MADEDVPIDSFTLSSKLDFPTTLPWAHLLKEVRWSYKNIVNTLKVDGGRFDATGERPGLGIMEGFAHDLETYCKYALASAHAKDKRVLDIGGGIGYGTYLLSQFADSVDFIDQSQEAVDFVESVWVPQSSNIKAIHAEDQSGVMGAGIDEDSYDLVAFMDVIEHLKDPVGTLDSIKWLLKDDGLLIITTPEEDFYPYSVCPKDRWDDPEEELLSEAIWPWHIQAFGEEKLLPLLEDMGFEVLEKSYTTYKKGYEYRDMLERAIKSSDLDFIYETLNEVTGWKVSDFELTQKRDPYFSAASYNIVVKKVL
jgi:2-polyprenyl-3-methyl-5-hydroxy-6-metoxy-1,4-benzoquinol methylase